MFNAFSCRGYHTKLRPIQLERVPGEERAAASVVKLLVPDLGPEVEWLLRTVAGLGSPVVFSHNDINTGNILVKEETECREPVVLIDYEFASYNYRGFDLANHFNEWMYDYRYREAAL